MIRERQWYSLPGFVFPPRFHGFLARDISDLFQCIVNNFHGIAIVGKISAHFLGFVFKVRIIRAKLPQTKKLRERNGGHSFDGV